MRPQSMDYCLPRVPFAGKFLLLAILAVCAEGVPLRAQEQPPASPVQRVELAHEAQQMFATLPGARKTPVIAVQQGSSVVFFSAIAGERAMRLISEIGTVQLPEVTLLYDFRGEENASVSDLVTVSPRQVTWWYLAERTEDEASGRRLELKRWKSFLPPDPFFTGQVQTGGVPMKWELYVRMKKGEAPCVAVPVRRGWMILRAEAGLPPAASSVIALESGASQTVGWGLHGQISCRTTIASPFPADFDGDGRTDFAFVVGARLLVFLQTADGTFPETPTSVVVLPPLVAEANGGGAAGEADWILGPSVCPMIYDLNNDGCSDILLVFPYDGSVAVHIARSGGKFENSPDDIVRVDGWLAKAWFQVSPDVAPGEKKNSAHSLLLAICPRLGLWTGIQAVASKQVPLRLESRAFDERGIPLDSPAWQCAIHAPIEMSVVGWAKTVEFGALVVVNADLTGDALPDLLLKADKDELCVFQGRGKGAYSREPARTIPVPELKGFIVKGGIEPVVVDLDGDGRDDVVFVGRHIASGKYSLFVVFGK